MIYGLAYSPAAPLLATLVFGAFALVFMSVSVTILAASGKPRWALALAGPLVPLAIIGHLVMIPKFGAIGAAWVTTSCAMLGALASVFATYRMWGIHPTATAVLRSLLISGPAYFISAFWPTPGILLMVKLFAMALAILLLYLCLGETSLRKIASVLGLKLPRTRHEPEGENGS